MIAAGHLDETHRKLADLDALRAELSRQINGYSGATIVDCWIIDALLPH